MPWDRTLSVHKVAKDNISIPPFIDITISTTPLSLPSLVIEDVVFWILASFQVLEEIPERKGGLPSQKPLSAEGLLDWKKRSDPND